MSARPAECKCTDSFTCGYCLANAKPYFFTLDDGSVFYVNPTREGKRDPLPDANEVES